MESGKFSKLGKGFEERRVGASRIIRTIRLLVCNIRRVAATKSILRPWPDLLSK
jgi:hypothetical protein